MSEPQTKHEALLADIRALMDAARGDVARAAISALTLTYWRIGPRIGSEILKGERAAYGGRIIASVSRRLEAEYGEGFGEKNLRRMVQFAEVFPDEVIFVALIRQLPLWLPRSRDWASIRRRADLASCCRLG